MKQTLYLDIKLAERAVSDNLFIESLAFAILIKLTFVSSRVQSATIERCKHIFGIGSTRMCRIVRNGIEFGLLKRDNRDLVALSLKRQGAYNIRLDFESKTYSRTKKLMAQKPKSERGEIVCQYSLKEVIDIIRKAVLLNHISKQTECEDTHKMAKGSAKSMNQFRRAKTKCKRMLRTDNVFLGLSRKRIMNIVNVGKAKAKKFIDSLCLRGLVKRVERSVKVSDSYVNFSYNLANKYFKETGMFGFLYRKDNQINCKLSNQYVYSCDLITYIR